MRRVERFGLDGVWAGGLGWGRSSTAVEVRAGCKPFVERGEGGKDVAGAHTSVVASRKALGSPRKLCGSLRG